MTPSTFEPMYISAEDLADDSTETKIRISCTSCRLVCNVQNEYPLSVLKNYSDIIKSVDIFISAPVYTYKQSGYDKIDSEHCYNAQKVAC